jgi:hypothetical protein
MGQTQADGTIPHRSHCPNKRIKAASCPCREQKFALKRTPRYETTWADKLRVATIEEHQLHVRLTSGQPERYKALFLGQKLAAKYNPSTYRPHDPQARNVYLTYLEFDINNEVLRTGCEPCVDYTHGMLIDHGLYIMNYQAQDIVRQCFTPDEAFALLAEWKAMYPNWKTMSWRRCLCACEFECEKCGRERVQKETSSLTTPTR